MNKIIQIGHLGDYVCYLNISKDEAIEKYFNEYPTDNLNFKNYLINTSKEFTINDKFFLFGNLKTH
jgi:hypothetical protein